MASQSSTVQRQTGLAGHRGCRPGERARRQVVPRPIDQIACPADGVGDGLALTQPLAQRRQLGLVELDHREALDVAVGLTCLIIRALELAEPIEAEERSLGHGLGRVAGRQAADSGSVDDRRQVPRAEVTRPLGDGGRSLTHMV